MSYDLTRQRIVQDRVDFIKQEMWRVAAVLMIARLSEYDGSAYDKLIEEFENVWSAEGFFNGHPSLQDALIEFRSEFRRQCGRS